MITVARNHPCPCGSGTKYKLCCLGKQEAELREAKRKRLEEERARLWATRYKVILDDPLDLLSNQARVLIAESRLDEAERVCQQLLAEYPEYIDGLERTAQLHEAHGDIQAAADTWRQVLAMAKTQDGFEPASYKWMQEQIERLESS